MSELITRRTFLKATGAAALVAAAGSMLVGCGDGAYASLPKIWLLLPSIIAISLILALLPQISAL